MVAVAAVIAVVGVVMTVGPVVGWIAGMAFVIAGIIELEDYVKLARRSVGKEIFILMIYVLLVMRNLAF